VNNLHPTRKQ